VSSVGLQPDKQVQSSSAGPSPLSGNRAYAAGLLLILLTVALYYPVRKHPYVNYDDNVYVTDNLHVQSGLTWDTVEWSLVTYNAGNWHPLTWISHALDVEMYDTHPGGAHQTSMLLHGLSAALLFWVLLRVTGYTGRSFMVAALFAVHPVNVEAVAWISERKTVLSMLFFILALGAYRWYVENPKALRYAVVALLFALGLMAKPQIITFPFVLLLWDYWPLRRDADRSSPGALRQNGSGGVSGEKRGLIAWRGLVLEKIPLFVIAAASAVITMKAQRSSGAVLSLGASPLSVRLSNALVSYVRYLLNAFWPSGLAPMYPHPGDSLRAWQVYGSLLILLIITMLVVQYRHRRYLLVGWLWFLGTMVPMIGLVQVGRQALADRYAYLPFVGIFIMVCWGLGEFFEEKRLPAKLLPVASAVIILALCITTRRQIGYWADNVILWTHTIQVTPPNYVAEDNLGGALLTRHRMGDAIVHFRAAAEIHPVDPISAFNIGYYEHQQGDLAGAIEWYKKAIILTTSPSVKAQSYDNMGRAYRALGEADQARECFEQAQKLQAQ
jgi:hypothetical protein